ncbi:MAG: hypothetical protein GWP05_09820, partial [Anaerolineaceae bacterium]|nr:hypothetical protein [Anaerolineaceae bacterium]
MTPEKRALLFRILSVGVFFLVAFLLASLITYDASDPPGGNSRTINNICGAIGAYVSYGLLSAVGMAAYLAIVAAVALIGCYVVRGSIPRRYLLTVGSLTVLLFLALSLISFDAAGDWHRSYSSHQKIDNACGVAGAFVAYYVLAYAGVGIWLALLAGFIALAAAIARVDFSDKALRAVGVVLLVCCVSSLATVLYEHGLLKPAASSVLPEGPGGLLGLFLSKHLLIKFGSWGSYLLVAFVAAVGLMLSTDMLVLLFPLAILRWLKKRRLARFEALRQASDRIRNGFVAARDAMAAGAVTTVAAATASRPEPKIRRAGKKEKNQGDGKPEKEQAVTSAEQATAEEAAKGKPKTRLIPKIRLPGSRKAKQSKPTAGSTAGRGHLVDSSEGPGESVPAYDFPPLDLLDTRQEYDVSEEEAAIRQNAVNLEATLRQFGVEAEVVGIDTGPVITRYEVNLGAGIKVGKVISLSDDLAIGLRTSSVRIVAPLPGRGTIGIEVPNQHSKIVNLRESIEDGLPLSKRFNLPLFLGKDSA